MVANICTSVNSKYVRYLYVMLVSLLENNSDYKIHVFVLERDLTEWDKKTLQELFVQYNQEISFLHIDVSGFSMLPTNFRYSLETYFRFKIPEMIPQEVEKILYLDVDLIIQKSIRGLFEIEMGDYYFAACRDFMEPELIPSKRELFGRYDDLRYFNAGVMLWNLKKIRGIVRFEDLIHAGEELNFNLPCVDQEILNYLYYDKNIYLDPEEYNYLVLRELSDPKDATKARVLHYCWFNPWQVGPKSPTYLVWWKYAKKTPFYLELLEEQLKRTEEHLYEEHMLCAKGENQVVLMKDIFAQLYDKRGRGILKEFIKKNSSRFCFYGAGYMAERVYDFFVADDVEDSIVLVVDQWKEGEFFKLTISANIEEVHNYEQCTVIVTPTKEVNKIKKQIQDTLGDKADVITLLEFLEQLRQ